MKKQVLMIVPFLLLVMGCSKSNNEKELTTSSTSIKEVEVKKRKTVKADVKENITFYSDLDEIFHVSLPVGWQSYEDPEELMDGGNLSFQKDEYAYGNIAISEAVDFENFEQFSKLSYDSFEIPTDNVDSTSFEVGEFSGTRYIFNESVSGFKMRYSIYILKGSNEFIEGQFWSQESKFDTYFDEGNSIFESLTKEK